MRGQGGARTAAAHTNQDERRLRRATRRVPGRTETDEPWNEGGAGELGRTGGEASGAGNSLRYDDQRITECTRQSGRLNSRRGRDGQLKWVGIQSRARGGAVSGSPALAGIELNNDLIRAKTTQPVPEPCGRLGSGPLPTVLAKASGVSLRF